MIDRKQNWRSATSKPTVLMFFIVMLACGATTPVRSQSSDNKTVTMVTGTSDEGDEKVVISQMTSDAPPRPILGFPEGLKTLVTFLSDNIAYPPEAIEAKVQGDVTVDFTVTQASRLTNCRITKKLHPDLDKAVIEVVKKLPVRKQQAQDGDGIDTDYAITVKFALPDGTLPTEPTVSVVGVKTGNMELTMKSKDALSCVGTHTSGTKTGIVMVRGQEVY